MAHSINNLLCTSCGKCIESCPRNAISEYDKTLMVIDETLCVDCGTCMKLCMGAISASGKKSTVLSGS